MTDEEVKQRVRYLVEHGGLWDDPLADVRRWVRVAVGLSCAALLAEIVHILV